MSNLEPISGFEFRVTSSLSGFDLGSAYGGSAADPASILVYLQVVGYGPWIFI